MDSKDSQTTDKEFDIDNKTNSLETLEYTSKFDCFFLKALCNILQYLKFYVCGFYLDFIGDWSG